MGQQTLRNAAHAGAHNLLVNCAGAGFGQHLLILRESPDLGYFDAALAPIFVRVARGLGMRVSVIDAPFMPETPELPADLRVRMRAADITLFLARLGDQLRFSVIREGRAIVCFAVTEGLLGSAFGTADHGAFNALKSLVNSHLAGARHVRVTCPQGTDFEGAPAMGDIADTSVLRFPVSVFAPVPGAEFSGQVALPGFLAGTGSRYYSDYLVRFCGPVTAHFARGLLTRFTGAPDDVARAEAHYDRISMRYGIQRNMVHSWHAGIHPGCGYGWNALDNMERWSGVAFGNPRILHLHTCGAHAPGEISWNVIDPTVSIDGVAVWDKGRFHPERLAGGAGILAAHPMVRLLFDAPDRRIGLQDFSSLRNSIDSEKQITK